MNNATVCTLSLPLCRIKELNSSIAFDSGGTDVEYVTADVSFRYDVYTVENLLNNDTEYEGKPV